MFGPPKPVNGKCNATLHIADDYGDNHATIQCQLEPEHKGPHKEKFRCIEGSPVVITWKSDCRKLT